MVPLLVSTLSEPAFTIPSLPIALSRPLLTRAAIVPPLSLTSAQLWPLNVPLLVIVDTVPPVS